MIAALLALVALNVATMLVAARREARLLDALMTRTPAEYIAAKKADSSSEKPKRPGPQMDPDPDTLIYPIGF